MEHLLSNVICSLLGSADRHYEVAGNATSETDKDIWLANMVAGMLCHDMAVSMMTVKDKK
jgi:hypothetical protein